jgi:hypothetical protein
MRRVVLLCAVVAAALLGWWLLRDDVPTPDGERPPAPVPSVTTAAAPPAKAQERDSRRAVVDETPAPSPPPARAVEKVTDSEAGATLRVVELGTNRPLAGVHVAFLPVEDDQATWPADVRESLENRGDAMDAITEHGRTFVTDDSGDVVLPKFESMALVAARQGDLRGISMLFADDTNWRLALHRPVPLAAIVQDAEGHPCVGVGVVLLSSDIPLNEATTDAKDGIARFADVLANASMDDSDDWTLRAALPFAERVSVAVDPNKLPADPIRLVLPPCGRVRCEVVDEAGASASLAARLRLPAAEAPRGLIPVSPSLLDDTTATVEGGVARFPYVGLGLQLEIEVASTDDSRVTVKQKFAGPTAAGEETVVRVTVGGRRPGVVGRLADAKGAPIAGLALVAGIIEPGRSTDIDWGERVSCTTDAGGRFRFAFDRDPGDATSAKLEIGRSADRGGGSSVVRIALVDLPAVLPSGDVDVGDVVYRGTGLLVGGVVVDEEGKPLAGVTIAAMETGGGAMRSPLDEVAEVKSGADGQFRLEGDPSQGRVLLGASLDGRFVAARLSFAAGATDVRVVMQKAGGIAGSVRLPSRRQGHDGWVLIQGPTQDNGDTGYRFDGEGLSVAIEEDGKFEVRTLRPGRARVAIRLGWNEDDTILVVEDVEVVAGQVTRDPRLQDVDASKSLRALKVLVRDRDGKPVQGAEIHFRPVGSDGYWKQAGSTDENGTATVQAKAEDASKSGLDLVVTAHGYRSGVVRAAKDDATIVLEPAKVSVVTVRLASGSPIPDPPYQLAASLHWIEPGVADDEARWHDPRDIRMHDAKFGKDRVLTFETFDAGRYRVDLMLWEMEMSGGGGSGIDSVPESVVVTVGADGAPAEVFVGVDPDELKRLTSGKR